MCGGGGKGEGKKKATAAAKKLPTTKAKTATAKCPLTPKTYGKAITIEGDEEFRKKTIKALDDIKKTKTGKAMLESIEKSGKKVTIKPTTGGNSETEADPSKAYFADEAKGKAGPGTDSTVYFNPDRDTIGTQKWEKRPPAVGLAHELVHSEQAVNGTTKKGQAANDAKKDPSDPKKTATTEVYELETAGIPPHDKYPYNENKFRSEWDPKQPERKYY